MSTKDVGPALTPEEWASFRFVRKGVLVAVRDGAGVNNGHGILEVLNWFDDPEWCDVCDRSDSDDAMVWEEDRRAVAALALHGQPFGFTHEDVDALFTAADRIAGDRGLPERDAPELLAIASRISALLPPREREMHAEGAS